MIKISYFSVVIAISIVWLLQRIIIIINNKKINWKYEIKLLLVYICIIVVARFTFFPFFRLDGKIQPLILDTSRIYPFRINVIPFLHLFEHNELKDVLINVIGNVTMFIPVGIVFPVVYTKLNTHKKVIISGICFSFVIELLQLPFYDRVTDIDDLILNSFGFIIGYILYMLAKKIKSN